MEMLVVKTIKRKMGRKYKRSSVYAPTQEGEISFFFGEEEDFF